jgi:hypothetical protein
MLIYWVLFLLPLAIHFSPVKGALSLQRMGWWSVGALNVLLIGWRYKIGPDWTAYQRHLDITVDVPFLDAITTSDIGYAALNWLVALCGGDIYDVNVICAAVFVVGLVAFARTQAQPWLILALAVPYTIVVVGMSYTRQSAAMGMELLAIIALIEGRNRRFLVYGLIGVLFHKSMLVVFPLFFVAKGVGGLVIKLVYVLAAVLLGATLIWSQLDYFYGLYIKQALSSDGGLPRVLLTALPALGVMAWGRRLGFTDPEYRIWRFIAILAIACVPLTFVASTAIDRTVVFFSPIQFMFYSRMHLLVPERLQRAVSPLVALMYGAMLHVFLTVGNYTESWVPYQFMPLVVEPR